MKTATNVFQHLLIVLFVYLLGLVMVPIPLARLNIDVVNLIFVSKDYLLKIGLVLAFVNSLPYLVVSFVSFITVLYDDDILKIKEMNNIRTGNLLLFAAYLCLYLIYQSEPYTYDIYFFTGYGSLMIILFYILVWKDPKSRDIIINLFRRIKGLYSYFSSRIKT